MKFAPAPQNPAEKDPRVLVDVKLKHDLAARPCGNKANSILGCVRRSVASRSSEVVIIPLFLAVLRPQLRHCVHLWGPQSNRDDKKPSPAKGKLRGSGGWNSWHMRQVKGARLLQHSKEKTRGKPKCCLPLPEGVGDSCRRQIQMLFRGAQ